MQKKIKHNHKRNEAKIKQKRGEPEDSRMETSGSDVQEKDTKDKNKIDNKHPNDTDNIIGRS